MKKKILFIDFVAFLALIIFDLWTKGLAVEYLADGIDFTLIPGVLEFHYLENTGAAFSILSGQMVFFYIITPVLFILLLYVLHKLPINRRFLPLRIALVLLASGAIGNFVDRITLHYVRDFIYFSLIDFPVFNVADIYVTLSIIFIIYLILFVYKEDELDFIFKKKESNE